MLGKVVGTSTVTAALLLVLVLQTTTPSTIGPVGLLAVFFLLYVFIAGVFTGFGWLVAAGIAMLGRIFAVRRPMQRPSVKRVYYFASVLALAPVMTLAMKSIGSLGLYETVLVALFVGIALLYVSRRNF